MLPIVVRGQSMDSALAQFIGVALTALCNPQNPPGNDFAVHFQLADILKRPTSKVVCLFHGGQFLRIKGAILKKTRSKMVLLVTGAGRKLGVARTNRAN